jgi:hypothetical protein
MEVLASDGESQVRAINVDCHVPSLIALKPSSKSMKWNGKFWDKAVCPVPRVERQLLPEADVECLFGRHGVTTEAGPMNEPAARDGRWG